MRAGRSFSGVVCHIAPNEMQPLLAHVAEVQTEQTRSKSRTMASLAMTHRMCMRFLVLLGVLHDTKSLPLDEFCWQGNPLVVSVGSGASPALQANMLLPRPSWRCAHPLPARPKASFDRRCRACSRANSIEVAPKDFQHRERLNQRSFRQRKDGRQHQHSPARSIRTRFLCQCGGSLRPSIHGPRSLLLLRNGPRWDHRCVADRRRRHDEIAVARRGRR